jgi:hypothetical protein
MLNSMHFSKIRRWTKLGPPFFNSSAAVESAPAALLFFRYISAPSISSQPGKSMSFHFISLFILFPSSLKATGRVGYSDSVPSSKCSSKCSFHLASTVFLLVNSSPFLARHITTCGSNGRLTSLRRL